MTATGTLASLMDVVIGTTVDFATILFTTYWPYLLVFGIVAGIVGVAYKFITGSMKKR